jgi:16S rRNA (adenine1518-N6/adenine1519-N6)-dimethyltransferase
MKHVARKRFGQNFLTDNHVLGNIIDAIGPLRGEAMVEIGPGLAAMTALLLKELDHMHVVELDRDLVARLEKAYPREKLTFDSGPGRAEAARGRQPAV